MEDKQPTLEKLEQSLREIEHQRVKLETQLMVRSLGTNGPTMVQELPTYLESSLHSIRQEIGSNPYYNRLLETTRNLLLSLPDNLLIQNPVALAPIGVGGLEVTLGILRKLTWIVYSARTPWPSVFVKTVEPGLPVKSETFLLAQSLIGETVQHLTTQ